MVARQPHKLKTGPVRFWHLPPIRLWFKGFCITDQKQKRTLAGLYAGVAQQVVQLICNQQVVGSIPIISSNMERCPSLAYGSCLENRRG